MSPRDKPARSGRRDYTGVQAFIQHDESEVDKAPRPSSAHEIGSLPDVDEPTQESPAPQFPEHEDEPIAEVGAQPRPASPPHALWDEPEPPRRRPLPKKAAAAALFGLLLLVLPLLLRHHKSHGADDTTSSLPEDLVMDERDLKNRVEVTADDFRPRHADGDGLTLASAVAPALSDEETDSSLAGRRKRRAQDPEDLVSTRSRSKDAGPSNDVSSDDPSAGYQRPYVYFEASAAAATRSGVPGAIAPAGTLVPAVLTSPVELRGGTATIIAQADADGPVPKRSRFVGSASSDGEGRLALRFERLLLPDGREAKIQGEAQDASGSFGIEGVMTTDGGNGAVARSLAQDTATDVASETLNTFSGGLAGRLLQRAVGRASAQRALPSAAAHRISLPAGTRFQIFLHQAVSVRG